MKFGGSNRARLIRIAGALFDLACAAAAVPLAYAFRLGEFPDFGGPILVLQLSLTAAALVSFYMFGLNQGSWRYASIEDLLSIIQSVVMAMLVAVLITFAVSRLEMVPRTVPIAAMMLLILMMSGPRLIYRIFKDRYLQRAFSADTSGEPVLIIGYSDEADAFMRALGKQKQPQYRVVGIIDHNSRHVGRRLHTVKVLGAMADLNAVVSALRNDGLPVAKLVVSPSKASVETMERIVELAADLGLPVFTLPSSADLIASDERGQISPQAIRLEDLLGRPPAQIDLTPVSVMLQDKTVLVTGGGGSIGSELVMQIARFAPREIVILDHSEFNLYSVDQMVRQAHPEVGVRAVLGDVRDRAAIQEITAAARPQLVFHAAALKHVPLVEGNVIEGARTNVLGTINVADAAVDCKALAFVMISTDKAVNPTNVMGATKRFAEVYCQSLDVVSQNATKFTTVRFGNVLGSAGSVVPLFTRQIAQGGPLTVTHPEMMRYFMTMREAVKLVLSASARGISNRAERGKIMVLDMGRPVKILDLALRMIQLAGLRPGVDIKVEITGLRPGEKLYEERLEANEHLVGTESDWLHIASPRDIDAPVLARAVLRLEDACNRRDETDALTAIREIVPELSSQHEALVGPDAARVANEPIPISEARSRLRR